METPVSISKVVLPENENQLSLSNIEVFVPHNIINKFSSLKFSIPCKLVAIIIIILLPAISYVIRLIKNSEVMVL